jgi:hypothetical protein
MAKKLALLFGIVLALVGVLGFVSNPLVGANGLFETNTLHNLVNLVIGVVLLLVAFMAPMKSGMWLKVAGVVYLILVVLGFLMAPGGGTVLGLTISAADHWLHLVLGVVLLIAGFSAGKSSAPAMPMQQPGM